MHYFTSSVYRLTLTHFQMKKKGGWGEPSCNFCQLSLSFMTWQRITFIRFVTFFPNTWAGSLWANIQGIKWHFAYIYNILFLQDLDNSKKAVNSFLYESIIKERIVNIFIFPNCTLWWVFFILLCKILNNQLNEFFIH